MMLTRLSSRILDALLTEQRWFKAASPGVRRGLACVEGALFCAAASAAFTGVYRWHSGHHGRATVGLIVGVLVLVCLVWTPLARFLAIERARDRACEQYLEYAREDSARPEGWPALAVRHALSNRDRATAIALCARLEGADLPAAQRTVAAIDRELTIEDEKASERISRLS